MQIANIGYYPGSIHLMQNRRSSPSIHQIRKQSSTVIIHYGVIEYISVKGFYKLYGNVVIEVHRLL
ncbi:DUF2652 domain-containing protein [Flavitalea antarctica]